MPIPKPKKSESKDDFVSRCMGDKTMNDDFPDQGQRAAVCYATWNSVKQDLSPENMEHMQFSFESIECHDKTEGKPRTFRGVMVTNNVVSRNLKIKSNAFDESIADYVANNRLIKIFYNHNTFDLPAGGADPSSITYKNGKWYVEGVLAETSLGNDVYILMQKKILSDLSVGFSVIEDSFNADDGSRTIKKAWLWEFSIVGEPADKNAKVSEVFKATTNMLPLGSRDAEWDSAAADKRVREFTKSTDSPSADYKKAFFWYDDANTDNFGAYKLPYADVANGKLVAMPRGIFASAAVMRGARGGVDIPVGEKQAVINHIRSYYKKMDDVTDPWEEDQKQSFKRFDIEELKDQISSKKDFEMFLRESGAFSKQAAIYMASFLDNMAFEKRSESGNDAESCKRVELLKDATNLLKNLK